MKTRDPARRILQALWSAGRDMPAAPPEAPPGWTDSVMAEIRRIGPLPAAPAAARPAPPLAWTWATAAAACLVVGLAWALLARSIPDESLAELWLEDPSRFTLEEALFPI